LSGWWQPDRTIGLPSRQPIRIDFWTSSATCPTWLSPGRTALRVSSAEGPTGCTDLERPEKKGIAPSPQGYSPLFFRPLLERSQGFFLTPYPEPQYRTRRMALEPISPVL